MSSARLEEIVDIGNKMCGPFLFSHPRLHLPNLWTPKPSGLQGGLVPILIVVGTDSEVLQPVLFNRGHHHPLL